MKKSPRSLLSPSVLVWLPSLVAIIASATVAVAKVHAQTSSSQSKDTPGKLPPFLKVDGLYYLDGNEDDLVKVLELSPETGWMRVQIKGAESWVNVANLSTVTPISKEAAAKLQLREEADYILTGANEIADAIDAYATKNNLPPGASFKWQDIRKFLKPDASTYNSDGKDVTGRPYIFGKVSDGVKVNPETVKEVAPVIDDADAYWGKFKGKEGESGF